MNHDILQNTRYKLQRRYRRFHGAEGHVVYPAAMAFWTWVTSNEMSGSIVADLRAAGAQHEAMATEVVAGQKSWLPDSELEAVAIGIAFLDELVSSADQRLFTIVGATYQGLMSEDPVELIRDLFLEPLYDAIDERLDDERAVLGCLLRFKHTCEWFRRQRMHSAWKEDTTRGERRLCKVMYEYLFEQGLPITIEAETASGSPDFISPQGANNPLVADAKVYVPSGSRGATYLAKGFGQLVRYAEDLNQPVAYLVVFVTDAKGIRFELPSSAGVPYTRHNGKTVFILAIDIHPHEVSASKRGRLRPAVITHADLVGSDPGHD